MALMHFSKYPALGNAYLVIAQTHADDSCLPDEALARQLGPLLEQHELFPNRSNVQFVKVLDRHTLQIEIWERGAGYTFASGSSSCAAAAVARKLNLVEAEVCVKMRGGEINIDVAHDYRVTMTGPVRKIAEGDLAC